MVLDDQNTQLKNLKGQAHLFPLPDEKDTQAMRKAKGDIGKKFVFYTELCDECQGLDEALKQHQILLKEKKDQKYGEMNDLLESQCKTHIQREMQKNPAYRLLQEFSSGKHIPPQEAKNFKTNRQKIQEKASSQLNAIEHAYLKKYQDTRNKRLADILKTENTDENTLFFEQIQACEFASLAQEIEQEPIKDFREQFRSDLAKIWIEKEDPLFFESLQDLEEEKKISISTQQFRKWVERQCSQNSIDFEQAGFPLTLKPEELPQKSDIQEKKRLRERPSQVLGSFFHTLAKKKGQKTSTFLHHAPSKAISPSLDSLSHTNTKKNLKEFAPLAAYDTSFRDIEDLDSLSTLNFLRKHPKPKWIEPLDTYQTACKEYLDSLCENPGIENCQERILSFCHEVGKNLLEHESLASLELLQQLTQACLDQYSGEEKDLQTSINKLDNQKRTECLETLLQVGLLTLRVKESSESVATHPDIASAMQQWARLLIPSNPKIDSLIKKITPDASMTITRPLDQLHKMRQMIHQSPIGLEAVSEGHSALQEAHQLYKASNQKTALEMQPLLECMEMRCSPTLLPHRFQSYYNVKDPQDLFSQEKLGSTQGRELFRRTCYELSQNSSCIDGKETLVQWFQEISHLSLKDHDKTNLVMSHGVFLSQSQVLLGINTQDGKLINPQAYEEWIDSLTQPNCQEGHLRLLGFAHQMIATQTKIFHQAKLTLENNEEKDHLFSQLVCTRLSYENLLLQAADEQKKSLEENFEYHIAMQAAEKGMRELENDLIKWSQRLHSNPSQGILKQTLESFQREGKIDGKAFKCHQLSFSQRTIEGFVDLSSTLSWDLLHGALYQGSNRSQDLPDSIKKDPCMEALGLNTLNFKKRGQVFVYAENGKAQIFIKASPEGLIIQRKLKSIDPEKDPELLQYLRPSKMQNLPQAISERMGAKHYYLDHKGQIHAFNGKHQALFILKKDSNNWCIIHSKHSKTPYLLPSQGQSDPLKNTLEKTLGSEEVLISSDGKKCWIPALDLHVHKISPSGTKKQKQWLCFGGDYDHMLLEQGPSGTLRFQRQLEGEEKKEYEKLMRLDSVVKL